MFKCWVCRKKTLENFYLWKVKKVSWPLSDIKILCEKCFYEYDPTRQFVKKEEY